MEETAPELMCEIFSNIVKVKDIANAAISYPRSKNLLFDCIKSIQDEDTLVNAEYILRMNKLQDINAQILVKNSNELNYISRKKWNYLHLVLGRQFDGKPITFQLFMEIVQRFLKLWVENNKVEESFTQERLVSPLENKTLIIERQSDKQKTINYDDDKAIRFIYKEGIVHIYKNNVYTLKVRDVFFDILAYLNRNHSLSGLEVFANFVSNINAIEAQTQRYIDFFGYELDGLKTIGVSFHVLEDAAFWLVLPSETSNVEEIYFIPTDSILAINTLGVGIIKLRFYKFEEAALQIIQSLPVPNTKITNIELPINPDIIPVIIQNYPNIKTIGFDNPGLNKRSTRIENIKRISAQYPTYNLIVFLSNDPPEPILPNVEYRSTSLDYEL